MILKIWIPEVKLNWKLDKEFGVPFSANWNKFIQGDPGVLGNREVNQILWIFGNYSSWAKVVPVLKSTFNWHNLNLLF